MMLTLHWRPVLGGSAPSSSSANSASGIACHPTTEAEAGCTVTTVVRPTMLKEDAIVYELLVGKGVQRNEWWAAPRKPSATPFIQAACE